MTAPSAWVVRFAPWVPESGTVLDVACGAGRHTRLFLERGHTVVAVDRDVSGLADLAGDPRLRLVESDLEDGGPLPFAGRRFDGIVVVNYLHRPLLSVLATAVAPAGALIYETFARGQERLGRPTNPDFLLRPGELLDAARGRLRIVAYEDLTVDRPPPVRVQRICAVAD